MEPRRTELRRNLRMYLSRSLNRSFAPPDWLTVNLTLKCNLKCTMCTTCYDVPDELQTKEILDILDQAAAWGVRIFNPLGGELFMRPDLEQILQHAASKDFTITVTTNGTLINRRRAEAIARVPPPKLHLNISLDGPEAVHDAIRGKGMYQRALAGLRHLREADAAAGNPRRKILVNTIIHRENLDCLPAFLDEQAALGFDGVQLLNLFRHGEELDLWIRPEDLGRLEALVEELRRRRESGHYPILNSEQDLRLIASYYRGELQPLEAPCWAGWKELYINSDGTAIMCDGKLDFLAGSFGSVRERTLRQLWESPELKARREVVKSCRTPCIQNCYLRRESDSAMGLGKVALSIAREALARRVSRPGELRRVEGGELRLELSDRGLWGGASSQRFRAWAARAAQPVERCFEEPRLWGEYRDRRYLDFGEGFMGFEVVEKICSDLREARLFFPVLRLGWRGEPLTHPEWIRIFRFLAERVREEGLFEELRVETDARLLTEEIAGLAAEYGEIRQTWILRLDEDELERRLDNAAPLLALRGKSTRILASHVLVEEMDPWSVAEPARARLPAAPVAVGRMPEAGDAIWFRRSDHDHFQAVADADRRLAEVAEILGAPLEAARPTRRRCLAPERLPTVSWDGHLTLCPWDETLQNRVGSVIHASIGQLWDQVADKDRAQAATAGVPSRAKCRDCHHFEGPNAPAQST